MSRSETPKHAFLVVVPWGLHHVGGVNRAVLDLLANLDRNKRIRPVVLVTKYGYEDIEASFVQESIRQYHLTLRQPVSDAQPMRFLASFLWRLPLTAIRLRRLIKKDRVTAINVHYPSLSAFTFLVVLRTLSRPPRLILSFHGSDINRIENCGKWEKAAWTFLLKRAETIVACSSALAGRLNSAVPDIRMSIKTIHNGVNQNQLIRLANMGRQPSEISGKRYILNVATLEWKKGQDCLIHAFARIASSVPDLLLVIIGRPAESGADIRNLIDTLRLQGRVFIYEDVDYSDVLATMKEAELFVLPSRNEPFGIVLLEAATFSIPVVASKTGGIPEIIEHQESGLLVDPEDIDGLAAALTELLANKNKASSIASALNKKVGTEFTLAKVAQEYEQLADPIEQARR